MSSSKLTLIGMNTFFANLDDDLFKNLTLPEEADKDTLTENILLRGSDFEVLYPDPFQMQYFIGSWSKKMQGTFNRWFSALAIDYNPLENYDRMEHWTDEMDGTGSSSSRGTVDASTSDTVTHTKAAYDSSTYEPYEQTSTSGTNDTDTTDSNSTTTATDAEHNGRIHGNIGVLTSQAMLESELNLGYWNVYEKITELFLQEFTIPVYE